MTLDESGKTFDSLATLDKWDALEIPGEAGLYIGSLSAAMNLAALTKFRITHILSVLHDWRIGEEKKNDGRFRRKFIEVEDSAASAKQLAESFQNSRQWIRDAIWGGGRVLVHCHAGISRSATIVCSYMMFNKCMSVDDALSVIRVVRPIVMPNSSFFPYLRTLERTIHTELKKLLEERFVHKLVVNLVFGLLNIDCRNLGGSEVAIRNGDVFNCSCFNLPLHLCVSSDPTAFETEAWSSPKSGWENTTVRIDPKVANWCIVRVKELGDNWLLLREADTVGGFEYTLFTLPQLVGNQPSNHEEDPTVVLPSPDVFRICFSDD